MWGNNNIGSCPLLQSRTARYHCVLHGLHDTASSSLVCNLIRHNYKYHSIVFTSFYHPHISICTNHNNRSKNVTKITLLTGYLCPTYITTFIFLRLLLFHLHSSLVLAVCAASVRTSGGFRVQGGGRPLARKVGQSGPIWAL